MGVILPRRSWSLETSGHTVKALLSPRGACLILDLPEGGLNREGAY